MFISEREIISFLEDQEAILKGRHLVYTSGDHGEGYVNVRDVAHHAWWLRLVGRELGFWFRQLDINLVIGPRTLGEKLAGYAVEEVRSGLALECDKVGTGDDAYMEFSPKFPQSAEVVEGKRVAIIDDLLRTGSSFRLTADLVRRHNGIPVAAGAVVSRSPELTATDCGVEQLNVLATITGLGKTYSRVDCYTDGPCAELMPMTLRPGHGHAWIKEPGNENYPIV